MHLKSMYRYGPAWCVNSSAPVYIASLIAAGLSNTEIAASLVLSAATIKTHINHIFQKTGARDRAQAVRYAYQHGLA